MKATYESIKVCSISVKIQDKTLCSVPIARFSQEWTKWNICQQENRENIMPTYPVRPRP